MLAPSAHAVAATFCASATDMSPYPLINEVLLECRMFTAGHVAILVLAEVLATCNGRAPCKDIFIIMV